MSIKDKLGSLLARPNEDLVNKDDVSVWMKYAARALGSVGGGAAIFFGVLACLNIIKADVSCLIGGIWQMLVGFLVIVIEAPCCCMCIDYVSNVSEVFDRRPYWNRAALYVICAIPPISMCFGVSTGLGSGLIFATGCLYGLMALGKKAPIEEMQNRAANNTNVPSSGMKSSLVDNAQPMAFTGSIDSNV